MTYQPFPPWAFFATQYWEKTKSILPAVTLSNLVNNLFKCHIDISVTRQIPADLSFLNVSWPLNDQWHSMSTFKDICFMTSVDTARIVSMLFKNVKVCLRRTTIITCEDHKRILVDPLLLKTVQQPTHKMVYLHNKICIRINATRTPKRRHWNNWCVGCRKRQIKKKRIPLFGIITA